MRMVKHAQNFNLPLHFFENSLLLDLFLVENLDGNFVAGHLVLSHYIIREGKITLDFSEGASAQVLREPIVTNLNVKCHYFYTRDDGRLRNYYFTI